MNNDYVPLGWEQEEYNTAADYNPHGLNNDKPDPYKQLSKAAGSYSAGRELDFGEAYIYDYRLKASEVIYGD